MADVKSCGRCGVSIPGQAIIDGQAKLVNGQLLCAECAARPAGASAGGAPIRPAPAQAAAQPKPAAPPAQAPIAMPEEDEAPVILPRQSAAAEEAPALRLGDADAGDGDEITIFGGGAGQREAIDYKRKPSTSGTGAIRVKTFDTKLSRAAFAVLDEQINLWLDETGYEVKHVTANVGDIHGKTSIEPHLIINVWY